MPRLVINGGKKLRGNVSIHGAKNSVLPVLAATLLCEGESYIHNCPRLSDVDTSLKILEHLGFSCKRDNNTVCVKPNNLGAFDIPDSLMREMRSSVVFLGAILGRLGRAQITSPGGCELGPRPIDLHISSLERLGAVVSEESGLLIFSAPNGLCGAEISLSFPSVGATENIILAAATARGTTVIHNAAREPEISDLADFLNSAGARIYGCGSDTVVIHGVKHLKNAEHTIIPDRIVAATYMAAAAITGSDITLTNIMPSHLVAVCDIFHGAGCKIEPIRKGLCIYSPEKLHRVPTIRTLVYPGFPTDAGPLIAAMLSVAQGTSIFVENIFQNRFRYADELSRFGAKIKTEGRVAIIEGVNTLSAANAQCTDLRGGAALAIAALRAEGQSRIDEICHIKRGYEDFCERLRLLGAEIYEE